MPARTIREEEIDCVYSLFQVYHPRLWGPPRGIEHDIWTLLRELLLARERGAFDAPIVRHWGFDVHNMDLEVARALDGQIFCNREKLAYWTTPLAGGGCGLDLTFRQRRHGLPRQRPPEAEFMTTSFPSASRPGPGSCTLSASAGLSGSTTSPSRGGESTSTSTATRWTTCTG